MEKTQLNIQALVFVMLFSVLALVGSAVGFATRPMPRSLECQDSDGGIVPEVKGTFTNNLCLIKEDYCITTDLLIEMNCNELGKMRYNRISCKEAGFSKCFDGACAA